MDPTHTHRPTTSQSQADESISSASASSSSSTSSLSSSRLSDLSRNTRYNNRRKTRSHASPKQLDLSAKKKLSEKRKEMVDKAKSISSLDNSPANDRQLLVLRMVYDEITMYPSDAWMAIIAMIIRRSFKQVKNWFSNERQKRGTGKETVVTASTGDKYRIRPITLDNCKDWSDEWFEEVVMIHHYRILCNSRWQAGRALSDSSSIYDGRS
ncbi:hypothetical protein AGABI2DRAFT_147361 [Agaricus bisporus var. bisporus H97]|nr:hypothetical protein AGABI2DRAFT_147361 [Agaricus bisporus var. bisporus H97]EKV51009.1 hypothetical protein AGABI2DRAFT_147361 [Agaricus bisporus var. bisporus H97]